MKFERSSGILLHPTSLPNNFGIGDLGPEAYNWIDFLANSGCSIWQILPLGPTGYGDSPYQSFSSFAGNHLLISPELLLKDQLINKTDIKDIPAFPIKKVDYRSVITWKNSLLSLAFDHFTNNPPPDLINEFVTFKKENNYWLDDYVLFMTIKEKNHGKPWTMWKKPLRNHNHDRLITFRKKYEFDIEKQSFFQFLFFRQWKHIHKYANEKNIQIIGDIPIFLAHDSADVWAKQEFFTLRENGEPEFISGVPPDYFSKTGQLWGNPLYRWDRIQANNYRWWIERIQATLNLVDIIRLDHFRGFHAFWQISGDAQTAEHGHWEKAPGSDLFSKLEAAFPNLPFIAEDLGVITNDVIQLRERFKLPGMKVLQFAFADTPDNPFLPHNYTDNYVAYTGTHDNDTCRSWYQHASEYEKDFYRRYLQKDGSDIAWDFIRAIWYSVAVIAIAPMQDFLNLGSEARMNYPGTRQGNWQWRMAPNVANSNLASAIHDLNYLYGRFNK
jgi:4-alpha-glucanotransferase